MGLVPPLCGLARFLCCRRLFGTAAFLSGAPLTTGFMTIACTTGSAAFPASGPLSTGFDGFTGFAGIRPFLAFAPPRPVFRRK